METDLKSTNLPAEQQALFHLAFRAKVANMALAAMDEYGDQASALFIDNVARALSSNLLEELSSQDVLEASDCLLSSYDARRGAKDRRCHWQLRYSIDSIFQLRAIARELSALQPRTTPNSTTRGQTEPELLRLDNVPIPRSLRNKLALAGCRTVSDIAELGSTLVEARAGLTLHQTAGLEKTLGTYLASHIHLQPKGPCVRFFGKAPTLAHVLATITTEAESIWRDQQRRAEILNGRWCFDDADYKKQQRQLAKLEKVPYDFWKVGVEVPASAKPAGGDGALENLWGCKILRSPSFWEWVITLKLAKWDGKRKTLELVPSKISLGHLCKMATAAKLE